MKKIKHGRSVVIIMTEKEEIALNTVLSDFLELCSAHDKNDDQRSIWKDEIKVCEKFNRTAVEGK